MAGYVYFTEAQRDRARRTDLVDFLRRHGEVLKRSGSEYEWRCGSGKVTVKNNVWFHQYERVGGDAIAFMRRFFHMEYVEAVEYLLEEQGEIVIEEPIAEVKKQEFQLPQAHENMRRVYGYLLKKRFIDSEVIHLFAQKKLIYEDAQYHNAVFVGLDEKGVARHAHKRGTNFESTYKGNVSGSDARYSFHYIGGGDALYVFEAPIDLLSYITMHKENWQENSYVALCSIAPQAAVQILQDHPQIRTVYTCLDHDQAGMEGNKRVVEAVKSLGEYTVIEKLPEYKDWNECLKQLSTVNEGSECECQVLQ